ncbi:MAG: DUF2344 domain-containing protein [Clostridia bacterium]|nr:DUF2344 domain-containing protein [Clostridia bacterium]
MRIRFEFYKEEAARFLSQLDVVRLFERAARRAALPIVYTQGYNPHPKISFGPALAVGIAGKRECVDWEFEVPVDVERAVMDLDAQMPCGMGIRDGKEVPVGSPSINAVVKRGEYIISCRLKDSLSPEEVEKAAAKILAQEEIPIKKRTKRGMEIKNIRPGIYTLEGKLNGNILTIKALLELSPSGSVSPYAVLVAVLEELGDLGEQESLNIVRTGIFALHRGKLLTPMEILALE